MTHMELKELLDQTHDRILQGEGTTAVELLTDSLRHYSVTCSREEWCERIIPLCRRHPIHAVLLQDPYTARAFSKPRRYAGDAEMLDFIYTGVLPSGTTRIGADVLRATTNSPNGRSVVYRRDLLARRIDALAQSIVRPSILSLACGHLREAQQTQAVKDGLVGEFVAVDQDAQSLAIVEREQACYGVITMLASVGAVVRGKPRFRDLHFVYAAGLFDYLTDEFGSRLLSVMFDMLAPGGTLLIANFTPDNHGRGYMECIMDWFLICRSEAEMVTLTKEIDSTQVAAESVYRDSYGNVVYLELRKKA